MSHLSDKDIDRLSREAAGFYQPDDSMLSWDKLEQQLVRRLPEHPPEPGAFFRIRPLIWGPAVLLVAGITYYTIKNTTNRSNSTPKAQIETAIPKPDRQKKTDQQAPHRITPGTITENTDQPATGFAGKASAETLHGANGNSVSRPDQVPSGGSMVNIKNGTQHSDGGPGKPGDGTAWIYPDAHSRSLSEWADERRPNQMPDAAIQLPLPVAQHASPDVRGNDSALNRFAPDQAIAATPLKTLQVNRSLNIGIVMGPDYTQAGGMTNDQLSNNIGISIGYYITRRLSVNTGIQYTTKYYWADSKPFQPVPPPNPAIGQYGSFPRIESVNGSCSMFEIPLTLRYDFFQQGKTKLFVNAGLSSYLVRQQDYTYYFHNAGRPYEWQNENKDHLNYWFAVGDLSAGIEQSLGRGFSFQAEPFARLPFRGMGVGDIKMNSFGFLFSMRYSPVLGRSRK